jgi:hypothetical protein
MAVVWSVTNLEYTNDSDKGVVHAAWSATDTDGDYSGTVSGMESYTPDPSDSGYVAWDSLNEATVLSWVQETLGSDGVSEVEAKATAKLTEAKTPSTAWGLAW